MPDPTDDHDDPLDSDQEEGSGMGRKTMALVLSAVQRANERAVDAVVEQSASHNQRMGYIILVVLLILGAVVGVTASVTLPDGTVIGATPEGE
jgi:hypothetical protein